MRCNCKSTSVLVCAFTLLAGTAFAQPSSAPSDQSTPPAAQQAPSRSDAAEQQKGVDDYLKSKSGQGGKQEPSAGTDSAKAPSTDAVFVNGALNVPGVPKDSQTVPAKFSKRNETIDKIPIMAMGIGLNDEQRRKILETVRSFNASPATLDAKITEELASSVELYELPASVTQSIPNLKDLKVVPLKDKVLLVYAPNRIVVGQIEQR